MLHRTAALALAAPIASGLLNLFNILTSKNDRIYNIQNFSQTRDCHRCFSVDSASFAAFCISKVSILFRFFG